MKTTQQLRLEIAQHQHYWRKNIAAKEDVMPLVLIDVQHFKAMLDWIDELILERASLQAVIDGDEYFIDTDNGK